MGGTGYYFDKAEPLPDEIEHHMPDYELYKGLVSGKEYDDYSIGYLTRGCFRKCGFCVNQKYNHVFRASDLEEFYDPNRKKIALLDDNFFGWKDWKSDLIKLIDTGKPFKFKQGLDERLLTDEKCEMLFSAKYDGDFTFAFDNIEDYSMIEGKLQLIRKYTNADRLKFYVLVGFKSVDIEDIRNAFERIDLLRRYRALPYIMRYQSKEEKPYLNSEWSTLYTLLAKWCNQPQFCRKTSLYEYVDIVAAERKSGDSIYKRELDRFIKEYPEIALKHVFQKWGEK